MQGEPLEGTVIETLPLEMLKEAGLVAQDVSEIKTLRFYSWWYEDVESNDLTFRLSSNSEAGGGLKRRYVTVEYDLATQAFAIRSATGGEPDMDIGDILAVTTKSGATVEAWDLHVGATLNIMGRTVALMKAELSTALWIDHHGKRLKKLKATLLVRLDTSRHPGPCLFPS